MEVVLVVLDLTGSQLNGSEEDVVAGAGGRRHRVANVSAAREVTCCRRICNLWKLPSLLFAVRGPTVAAHHAEAVSKWMSIIGGEFQLALSCAEIMRAVGGTVGIDTALVDNFIQPL